jgi:curli biogenesis system outer membrane secretion channel CsgG
MKKSVVVILAISLLLATVVGAMAQRKTRIAVLRFEDQTQTHWWQPDKLGDAAADVFMTELLNTGKFSVIERARLNDILKEHNLVAQGAVTPQSAVELGKLLGAQLMVVGSVTEFGTEVHGARFRGIGGSVATYRCMIDVRVINVETSEILYADRQGSNYRGVAVGINSFEAGRDADYGKVAGATMSGAVTKLVEGLALASDNLSMASGFGMVADVDGSDVYINRGSVDGIKAGDQFKVMRLGKKIVDPETGQTMGQKREAVGVIQVVDVMDKMSICKLVSGDVQKGDAIEK